MWKKLVEEGWWRRERRRESLSKRLTFFSHMALQVGGWKSEKKEEKGRDIGHRKGEPGGRRRMRSRWYSIQSFKNKARPSSNYYRFLYISLIYIFHFNPITNLKFSNHNN
ncbi:hypothetical protein SK128_026998 [Halocaridina rubra]|uniref:Uncharacterized protein n=1 Tax=Halocaridina rubra TaxID=373956 RepID=A0AAN8ZYQ3_HALRR